MLEDKKKLIGEKYGRLTILDVYTNSKNVIMCKCQCDCGKIHDTVFDRLPRGTAKSCGCLRKEMLENGDCRRKHSGVGTQLYSVWKGMRERCYTKTHISYKNYGKRGIKICDEWKDFSNFREWSYKNGYIDKKADNGRNLLTIDRIDVNGDYSPENCRWVTCLEQANNTRANRRFEYQGETHTMAEWSRIKNIPYSLLSTRIEKGWSFEEAITKEKNPTREKKGNPVNPQSKKGRNKRPVLQMDDDGNVVNRYESVFMAAKINGVNPSHIHRVAKGQRLHTHGYAWKYESDYLEMRV